MARQKQISTKTKMVDLSAEKVAPPVKALIRRIDRSISRQFNEVNIPAFSVLAKTTDIANFFLHYNDYQYMLGENADLLIRIVKHAICEVITDDIYEQMSAMRGYVGVWDNYTIYGLVAATFTIMKADWSDEYYFTAEQFTEISQEDFAKLDPLSYMAFSAYTQNDFFLIIERIHNTVLVYITEIMKNRIPKAFAYSKAIPLNISLYNIFISGMKEVMIAYHLDAAGDDPVSVKGSTIVSAYLLSPATENSIRKFTESFEKIFLANVVVKLLAESGVSDKIVADILSESRIHILFDDPKDRTLGEINIQYTLVSKESVGINFNIQDVMDTVVLEEDEFPKTRKENLGKKLRTFLLNLCAYGLNIYMTKAKEEVAEDEIDAMLNDTVEE